MMMRWMGLIVMCGAIAAGCNPEPEVDAVPVPDYVGKSDNYIATSAQEYILSGSASVELPEEFDTLPEADQQTTLDELVADRTSEVTRAAQSRIDDLVDDANDGLRERNPDEEDLVEYFIYVKPSYRGGTASEPTVADGMAAFDFQMELVGSLQLIEIVDGGDGDLSFEVELDGEVMPVAIDTSPSTDAFPKYDELLADGVYDIAIHFGGDYNEERYDLETAKWTVEYLLENGWQHDSVSSFEDLWYDSGPFKRTLSIDGRQIEAHVYVYHANMDDDAEADQELLRSLVETSVAERDVVIYSGHAGANAGMILDYDPRYEFDDSEFDDVEMRDDYQIFVFDGCNSYRTYVDALMENPSKSFDNTDVVTTVNTTPFSAGYEIINRFVHWLTLADEEGRHIPVSWNTMLRGVNDSFPDVHYGVHGIDQDPKLAPNGGGATMCQPCTSDADCGGGGNYCVDYEDGAACSVACTTSEACGDGYSCVPLWDDPDLFYLPKQCVRTSQTCG